MSTISDIVSCSVLVYIFFKVAVEKPKSIYVTFANIGAVALLAVIYTAVLFWFPHLQRALVCLFLFTIPTCALCFKACDYRGWHFAAIFCSVDIIGFAVTVLASGISLMLNLHSVVAAMLSMGVLFCLAFYFHKNGEEIHRAIGRLKTGWRELALLTMSFYVYLYFILLYPKRVQDRPEYIPVITGFCIVLLLAYKIIISTVKTMGYVYDMEQEERNMKIQLEVQKKQLEEEKMRMLVSQIRPHYIYNTLMSIRYLTRKDPDTAYEMIGDFSKYLRANVSFADQDHYIRFEEELEHINAYVRIEKVRCKDKLRIVYQIAEEDFLIPPLTVEPLVENAIKHGFDAERGETVWIRSYLEGDAFFVEVEDDGPGIVPERQEEKHALGLRYVKKRLEMIKGAAITIDSPGEKDAAGKRGTKIRLRIPRIVEENSNETLTTGQ